MKPPSRGRKKDETVDRLPVFGEPLLARAEAEERWRRGYSRGDGNNHYSRAEESVVSASSEFSSPGHSSCA